MALGWADTILTSINIRREGREGLCRYSVIISGQHRNPINWQASASGAYLAPLMIERRPPWQA